MLDQLSHGRFEFGVGQGVSPPESRHRGLDPDSLRRRIEETLAVLVIGFTQKSITFKGEFFDFDHVPSRSSHIENRTRRCGTA